VKREEEKKTGDNGSWGSPKFRSIIRTVGFQRCGETPSEEKGVSAVPIVIFKKETRRRKGGKDLKPLPDRGDRLKFYRWGRGEISKQKKGGKIRETRAIHSEN